MQHGETGFQNSATTTLASFAPGKLSREHSSNIIENKKLRNLCVNLIYFFCQSTSLDKKTEVLTWVAAMQVPMSSLFPVFCFGKNCPTVPQPSMCKMGSCQENMCSFGDNCYNVAEYEGTDNFFWKIQKSTQNGDR
jgi:hypothetical protein